MQLYCLCFKSSCQVFFLNLVSEGVHICMFVSLEIILKLFLFSNNSFEPAASSITFTCYHNKKPAFQWTDSWRGELPSGLQGWKSGFTARPQSQSGVNRSHVCILNFYIRSPSLLLEIKINWIKKDVCENMEIRICRLSLGLLSKWLQLRVKCFSQKLIIVHQPLCITGCYFTDLMLVTFSIDFEVLIMQY